MSENPSNTAKRKKEFVSAIAGVEEVAKRLATHANEIIDIHNSDKSESELLDEAGAAGTGTCSYATDG